MSKSNQNKPRYSTAEIKAYYLGVGCAQGFRRISGYKAILFGLPKELRESFKNGMDREFSIPTRRFKDK